VASHIARGLPPAKATYPASSDDHDNCCDITWNYVSGNSTVGKAETEEIEIETSDRIKITFTEHALPNIPAISFKDNVNQLLINWYALHHLILGGQPVAIQDWDRVYKKTKAWKMFKSTYCNFKVSLTNKETALSLFTGFYNPEHQS
jgi:hypothetical protein